MEKGIGVGCLLHYPYLHAVGSLVEEGEFKAAYDVGIVDRQLKLIEEQIYVADCVDVAVEVDVAVFEAVDGLMAVRLDAEMLLLLRDRAFAVGDPFRFEVKAREAGVAAVFCIEYHPY